MPLRGTSVPGIAPEFPRRSVMAPPPVVRPARDHGRGCAFGRDDRLSPDAGRNLPARIANPARLGNSKPMFSRQSSRTRHRRFRRTDRAWMRCSAAKQLAEAGCPDAENQAVTRHKTPAMVQKYRAQASRSRASEAAQDHRAGTGDE